MAAPGGGGSAARGLPLRQKHATPFRVAIATGAAVGGVGLLHHHTNVWRPTQFAPAPTKRFLIPQGVAEIICGAVGEIVQVAVLYPLDTIKVRSQASSRSAAAVVREMVAANGGSLLAPALWRQLYAGVLGASVMSVAVGAIYYSSFCAAKRAALKATAERERRAVDQAASAGAADALPPLATPAAAAAVALQVQTGSEQQQQQQQLQQQQQGQRRRQAGAAQPHGPSVNGSVDLHHDAALAVVCSDDAAAARAAARAKARAAATSSSAAAPGLALFACDGASSVAAPAPVAAPCDRASSDAAEESVSGGGRLRANMVAAGVAALVGSLVEAPLELTKHKLQAGVISGSMMGHLGQTLRTDPSGLFVSLVPFCLKSLPFDATELLAYSSLKDAREAAVARSSLAAASQSGPSSSAPVAAAPADNALADLAIGAAAGAVAVVISHPMDTVKTVVETGSAAAAGSGGRGPLASARAFAQAGSALVARAGPGALFSGLGMRLAEQVPSTALYWVAVEGMRRALDPFVEKDPTGTNGSTQ